MVMHWNELSEENDIVEREYVGIMVYIYKLK